MPWQARSTEHKEDAHPPHLPPPQAAPAQAASTAPSPAVSPPDAPEPPPKPTGALPQPRPPVLLLRGLHPHPRSGTRRVARHVPGAVRRIARRLTELLRVGHRSGDGP